MKSTIISMSIVLVVMVVVPMIFLGDGEFLKKLNFDGFGSFGDFGKNGEIKSVVTDKRVEVYTWTDQYGVKQFSSIPPADGGASEKIVLSPDTNVMDPIKVPEKVEEEESASKSRVVSIRSPYTPGGMKDVFDNTRGAQEDASQRQAEQEKMMQELFPQMNGGKGQ